MAAEINLEIEPEETPESNDTVVVNDAPDVVVVESETETDDAIEREIDTAVAINDLEHRVAAVEEAAFTAEMKADDALAIADTAAEDVQEMEPVITEMAADTLDTNNDGEINEDDVEEDSMPRIARTHWLTRPLSEWIDLRRAKRG